MKETKVSFIEPVGGHGGNEFYDYGLCKFLNRHVDELILYTCDKTRLDEAHDFEFCTRKVYKGIYGDESKVLRGIRYIFGTLVALLASIRRRTNVAHFHIYHFSLLEFINVLLFRLCGISTVATIHDVESFEYFADGEGEPGPTSWRVRYLLAMSSQLIVHSEFARDSVRKIAPSVGQKLVLVPHGDTDFLYNRPGPDRKNDSRKRLGLDIDAQYLLFFGQIKAVKGLDILLRAMSDIDQSAHLLVVGKCWKQDIETYQNIVDERGLAGRVSFVNSFIDNEDVPLYFWASDIVCLPYKKIYSSGVALRAMDYRSAIVCSDLAPFKQLIEDGKTGVFFESESSDDLARKINTLLGCEENRALLAEAAKRKVDAEYSWPVVAKSTYDVYKRALHD